jgi:hypothetical protein
MANCFLPDIWVEELKKKHNLHASNSMILVGENALS